MELAKRCGFDNYTPEQAARDAMVTKIKESLAAQIYDIYPMYKLFCQIYLFMTVDQPKRYTSTVAEIKSFLQMCQYNQTFMFGTTETYSDITAQRKMLGRMQGSNGQRNKECNDAFGS